MKIMDNRTRTVLSLVTEEDLGILAKAGKVDKQQGAVLSQADLTTLKTHEEISKGGREAASDYG